jgi:hypothetical protein
VMETARTSRERAKSTARFWGLPLVFKGVVLVNGTPRCRSEDVPAQVREGISRRLVQLDGWGSSTAGHCGVLTADQGAPAVFTYIITVTRPRSKVATHT